MDKASLFLKVVEKPLKREMQARIATELTLLELAEWLDQKGWQELPSSAAVLNYCDRLWQKKVGNLSLNLYNYNTFQADGENEGEDLDSFAIELNARSADGYWTRHEKYGIRCSELKNVLDDQVMKLIKAWKTVNDC